MGSSPLLAWERMADAYFAYGYMRSAVQCLEHGFALVPDSHSPHPTALCKAAYAHRVLGNTTKCNMLCAAVMRQPCVDFS
jgi:hypothetical protein